MPDNEDYLSEVTRDLFAIARRAELGFQGEQIQGAVSILFYGDNKTFCQFSGALDVTFTYGRMLEAIMDLRREEETRIAAKAFEATMGELDKRFPGAGTVRGVPGDDDK